MAGAMTTLVIFAKAPQPGSVKTRLIPALGAEGAAALARRMLDHAIDHALGAGVGPVELCMSPAPGDLAWRGVYLPADVRCTAQDEGDLGQRMASAVQRVTTCHGQPVLLMGSDCPALTSQEISRAAGQLQGHDAVLIPAVDGGYALIGLKSPCPALFTDMRWSTSVVCAETLRRAATLGLTVWQGPLLHDIDEPADLALLPEGF